MEVSILAGTNTERDDGLYKELGCTWRHFAVWREKIFAGYLAVLAGLAVGFSHETGNLVRLACLAGAILASVVFWILDFRNSQLLNSCQVAAAALEAQRGGVGAYTALHGLRQEEKNRLKLTYGLGVDLLFCGVVVGASGGMLAYVPYIARLCKDRGGFLTFAILAIVCILVWRLQSYREGQWKREIGPVRTSSEPSQGK